MGTNKQIKITIVTIVLIAIVTLYLYIGLKQPEIRELLQIEMLALILLSTWFIVKGNTVISEFKNPKILFYNILLTTSASLIILTIYKYNILKHCPNIAYCNWVIDTFTIKSILLIGLFNILTTVYYITKLVQQKTLIQEPVQIYETSKKDAELSKLRNQINPHFLFNSLNSINALMQFDKDKARNMIVNLSQYYRNIINVNENQWQPVEKELEDIQLYCNIEKIRFGHRLAWQIDCDEELSKELIPPLLYQPLVENAIKYGLYGTLGTITIHIKVYKTSSSSGKQFITFQIANPFDPTVPTKPQGTGFGLDNIKKRLYLLFATNKLFTTKVVAIDETQSLFNAYLSIPIQEIKNNENKNPIN